MGWLACVCSRVCLRASAAACQRMAAAASSRHSTRTAAPRLPTIEDEQAAYALARMDERRMAAAMRLSLQSSWDSDDEESGAAADEAAASSSSDEEEEHKAGAADDAELEWTDELHDIRVPLPRMRNVVNRPPPLNVTALQLLQRFLSPELMEEFAEHTNAAAPDDWRHTTAAELYAFLGAHLYMGMCRLPETEMYWSETFRQLRVTEVFSRDRYRELLRYFRISPQADDAAARDPLPHVRSVVDRMNASFRAQHTPTQHLALDEAMCAYKGRSPIKQYIPSKPHKWGFKIWCLSSDDYLLHFEIYAGKEDDPSDAGATVDTALRMTAAYQGQHYILYTDSWFTSPALMNALAERDIRRGRTGLLEVANTLTSSISST
jgi:hypothetical protein